nr:unnamed protein product [Callosobruchus chinensis]
MPRNELSAFDRTRIIALWQEGLSRHQIATRLNVVRSTVSRTIRRYGETGEVNSRPRTGRPTVNTRREDRYIAQLARRERSVTVPVTKISIPENVKSVDLDRNNPSKSFGVRIEVQKAFKGAFVNCSSSCRSIAPGRAHQDWLLSQWRNVLSSDESRFGLLSDDYRERVWRERGGQIRLATATGVAPYRDGTQMFWGGIRCNGKKQLIHIPGTMTGAYYLQNIINAIVQPLRNEIVDQFIFMDDNARPHPTTAVQQALENENIARLEWLALSADLNPIKHVWDYVSRAIFNRNNPPRSTQELIVAATEEWDSVPQEVINNLIIGVHRRADALIRSKGGNTKY